MERFSAILGIFFFLGLPWLLSENRKRISFRVVGWGFLLQLILGILVLGIPALGFEGPLQGAFESINDFVVNLLNLTQEGSRFIFGSLIDTSKFGFIFGFQVLPTIIFFSSLMTIFYHWGIMQRVVYAMAWIMQKTLGTTGPESLAMGANVFVGQTEAPLIVRPFIDRMTRSELFCLMVGGMATVAGGVLAAYVGLLKDRIPNIAGHLITASLMSAPAALLISKILIPEMDPKNKKLIRPSQMPKSQLSNTIEAAAEGASEGLKLALNVAAMLLAFIALLALLNMILASLGNTLGFAHWGPSVFPPELIKASNGNLSLQLIFGWALAPLAWLMGIPWSEASIAGSLIGEKIALYEFVAYLHLSEVKTELSDRTIIILSYALCGFANFSSIAIQIGGIGGIAP
ncbi:MAG: hypothetical protein KDD22_08240, partial [Bdellovibrionales bacterium]|nr:hypothetical protein [Bdellovibrionales bacterium]